MFEYKKSNDIGTIPGEKKIMCFFYILKTKFYTKSIHLLCLILLSEQQQIVEEFLYVFCNHLFSIKYQHFFYCWNKLVIFAENMQISCQICM